MSFEATKNKVWIGSVDLPSLKVEAMYNPKELQIDKSVPWQKHPNPNANGLE